jgi:hypothetical protein
MFTMFVLCLWSVPAKATLVTTIYEFVQEQSTLYHSGGLFGGSGPYSIEGQFWLTVDYDAGVASFDQVDAILTDKQDNWYPYGRDLGRLFYLTELVSTSVSDSEIDFEGHFYDVPGDPLHWVVLVDLTFIDKNLVHLMGTRQRSEVVPEGSTFRIDAVAVAVPEPGTVCFLGLGGLFLKKRIFLSNKKPR